MTYIGAFDMGLAQTDGKYAFEAWKNCKYAGNTVGILPEELKALEDQYKACLVKWAQWAEETDSTQYEISDEDWNLAWQDGVNEAEEDTGYDGNNSSAETVIGAVGSGLGAVGAAANFVQVGAKGMAKFALYTGENAAEGLANGRAFNKMLENSWMVTAPLTLAVATLYTATQPNRKAHDALMELMSIMQGTLPQELGAATNKLAELEAGVIQARENAAAVAEEFDVNAEGYEGELAILQNSKAETQVELAEKQAEEARLQLLYDTAQAVIDGIKAKIDAGEQITPEELTQLNAANANLTTLDGQIQAIQVEIKTLGLKLEGINTLLMEKAGLLTEERADGAEATEEASAEIVAEQEAYDAQGAEIASKQGYIDEAASYDKQTQTLAIVEAASQGMNVVSATIASVKAFVAAAASLGTNAYAWACGAMGAAAAIMSGIGVGQQIKFAADIGKEIDAREQAQGEINTALGQYEYHLDNYANFTDETITFNQAISTFEFEAPDLSVVNYETGATPTGGTGGTGNPNEPEKPKEE